MGMAFLEGNPQDFRDGHGVHEIARKAMNGHGTCCKSNETYSIAFITFPFMESINLSYCNHFFNSSIKRDTINDTASNVSTMKTGTFNP